MRGEIIDQAREAAVRAKVGRYHAKMAYEAAQETSKAALKFYESVLVESGQELDDTINFEAWEEIAGEAQGDTAFESWVEVTCGKSWAEMSIS